MLPDLPGVLIAMVLFALVALAPGWAISYWFNLLAFRTRFITFKLAIALATSLAVSPILLVLIARWSSVRIGATVMLLLTAFAIAALIHGRRRSTRRGDRIRTAHRRWIRIVLIASIAWMLLACGWLLDVRIGNGLYMSVPWLDHTKRVAWIDAIMRTGVPPNDPSTYPGQSVKIFYYYGWYVWAATVQTLGGRWVGPIHVLIAGVVWSGWAFIGALALGLRYLVTTPLKRLRRCWLSATLLLCVTGLDIGPGLLRLLNFLSADGALGAPRTVEWWNEQVTGFIDLMIWVPHHIAGVIAGLLAMCLLRSGLDASRTSTKMGITLIMAVALASLSTLSLYVALPLAGFLVPYTIWCLVRHRSAEATVLAVAGIAAFLIASPYLFDLLRAPAAAPGIGVHVRDFNPLNSALKNMSLHPLMKEFANLLVLPLNYLIEFGFFLVAGVLFWILRGRGRDRRATDYLMLGLLCASFIIASFFRSTFSGNDLGWRTILWAQIILLLWSAEPASAVWSGVFGTQSTSADADDLLDRFPKTMAVLLLMLPLGVLTTAYDLFLLRFSPALWPDKAAAPPRALALRQGYEWIDQNTRRDSVLQHNLIGGADVFAGHYGNRQLTMADPENAAARGLDKETFGNRHFQIYEMFSMAKSPEYVHRVASGYGITHLVVKDDDANWPRKQSWFWTPPAVYENQYMRVIATKDLLAPVTTGATTQSTR